MRASIVLFVATSAVLVLVASTGAAHADGMAGKTPPASTALTDQQVDAIAAKRQAEAQFMLGARRKGRFGVRLAGSTCGARCGGGGYPSSASFAGNQTPQITATTAVLPPCTRRSTASGSGCPSRLRPTT